ncbi:MAG: heavy-metal-associated domain-containing protein [Cyanobium sp.]
MPPLADEGCRRHPSLHTSSSARRHRSLAATLRLAGLALILPLCTWPAWAGAAGTTIEVAINGMVCSFCAQGVERSLRSLPATAEVQLDLNKRLLSLTLRPGATIADEQLRRVIRHAGFDVRQIRRLPAGP